MLPFTTEDAVAVLRKAKNLNSALKNFLKKEIKPGDPAGRFVKDLKDLCDRPQAKPLESYIAVSRPAFDAHLLAIGKYAHVDAVNDIVGLIVDKYAEDFNSTYESDEKAITVKNEAKFNSIVKEAFTLIETQQATAGYPDSAFFKNLVLLSVFDKPVLEHILAK